MLLVDAMKSCYDLLSGLKKLNEIRSMKLYHTGMVFASLMPHVT